VNHHVDVQQERKTSSQRLVAVRELNPREGYPDTLHCKDWLVHVVRK